MHLVVDELAPDPVGAAPVLPEPVALFVPQGLLDLLADELVGSMGETALLTVRASSKFCEILAELSLVLGGISL